MYWIGKSFDLAFLHCQKGTCGASVRAIGRSPRRHPMDPVRAFGAETLRNVNDGGGSVP